MVIAPELSFAAQGLNAFSKIEAGDTAAANQIQSGTQTADMDEFHATQLSDAAQFGQAQAAQTDTFLRQKVQRQLGTMQAIFASANTEGSSPTNQAIMNRTQGQSDQQRAIQVGNLDAQAAESQSEAGMYTTAAQQTLNQAYANASASQTNGWLGAGSAVLTGLAGLMI